DQRTDRHGQRQSVHGTEPGPHPLGQHDVADHTQSTGERETEPDKVQLTLPWLREADHADRPVMIHTSSRRRRNAATATTRVPRNSMEVAVPSSMRAVASE